jgi:ribosomal protein L7/L12
VKITYNLFEIKQLVADKHNISVDGFYLEIENFTSKEKEDNLSFLRGIKDVAIGNKIEAIKKVKDYTNFGLWESKIIVENIDSAIDVVNRTGKIPTPVRTENGFDGWINSF